MNTQARIKSLQETLSRIVGAPVEITTRSGRAFTFSTDEVTPDLESKLRGFFGSAFSLKTEHDDECGSFCYAEARD